MYFRFAIFIFSLLFFPYWIWFPVKSVLHWPPLQQSRRSLDDFYNNINLGTEKQGLRHILLDHLDSLRRLGLLWLRCISPSGRGDETGLHSRREGYVHGYLL